jgi:hypothetical protein
MNTIRETIVNSGNIFFKNLLFFLPDYLQSATVTLIHHTLFPIIIFTFFFILKPCSPLKPLFFVIALIGYIMFILFNRCIVTDIEYSLCKEKNPLLHFIDSFYPETENESKIASKISLSLITLFFGCHILYDMKWFNTLISL